MHDLAVRSPLSFVLACAALVASALPQTAWAGDKYLQMLTAEERESAPAQRYAQMSKEEALEELARRGVSFVEVPEDKARGVVAPIRLTGRLNGLLVRGSGSEAQQATSPFEILDARLALSLYDFAEVLARHDIDEVVHYTMYRPGVAGYSTVKKIPLSQFKAAGGKLDDKGVVLVPAPPRPKATQRPHRTASSKAATTRRGTTPPHVDEKAIEEKPAAKTAAKKDEKSTLEPKPAAKDEAKKPSAKLAASDKQPEEKKAPPLDEKTPAKDAKASAKPAGKDAKKSDAKGSEAAIAKKSDAKGSEPTTANTAPKSDDKPLVKDEKAATKKADAKLDKLTTKDAKASASSKDGGEPKVDAKSDKLATKDAKTGAKIDAKASVEAPKPSDVEAEEEEAYVYVNVPKPSDGQTTSRHPAGLAIDVAILKKKNGTQLNVAQHFAGRIGQQTCGAGAPQPRSDEARELLSIVCEASDAKLFSFVLTPNFNQAHRDHFHMEIKSGAPWMLVH